ncbi:MAG: P-loop NTPase fold protein [Cyanobacteriota bacterium]|nr:P-loop NTPase fold protein [Cyanobacteriota bacterium]
MTESNSSPNSHIAEYLDYYCGLSHAPGFAVLLKGEWGSGKTWFIKEYCKQKEEEFKREKKRFLYVSLYGMTAFSDIEDAFFQQLHPLLASKGMAITGKIVKGLLKGTMKIDLNDDGKDDGNWSIQIPDIKLPESFKNADKSILIFDDLERCQIDTANLLGYINYFVEHQDLKVILLANEEELFKKTDAYKNIKEKLIGKTFEVSFDLEGGLKSFVEQTDDIREFLLSNFDLIEDLYGTAEYKNLRSLKQIIFDFERIYKVLPEKAKAEPEILKDIMRPLIALSIEIQRGNMKASDITKLPEEYSKQIQSNWSRQNNLGTQNNEQKQSTLQEILDRYPFLYPFSIVSDDKMILDYEWWQTFFDSGVIDIKNWGGDMKAKT